MLGEQSADLVAVRCHIWVIWFRPKKLLAMKEWPLPLTPKALRGVLGLTGDYWSFINDYSGIAGPLTEKFRKNSFIWSEKSRKAFQQLKEVMTQPPVLALLDFSPSLYHWMWCFGLIGRGSVNAKGETIGFLLPILKKEELSYLQERAVCIVFSCD